MFRYRDSVYVRARSLLVLTRKLKSVYKGRVSGDCVPGKDDDPAPASFGVEMLTNSRHLHVLPAQGRDVLEYTEPVFLNVYGAQDSIPRNEFRQPMQPGGPVR